jgi:hypothetical protein
MSLLQEVSNDDLETDIQLLEYVIGDYKSIKLERESDETYTSPEVFLEAVNQDAKEIAALEKLVQVLKEERERRRRE